MSFKQYKNWIQEAISYGKPKEVMKLVPTVNQDQMETMKKEILTQVVKRLPKQRNISRDLEKYCVTIKTKHIQQFVKDIRMNFEHHDYIEMIKLIYQILVFYIDQTFRERGLSAYIKCDFREKLFWLNQFQLVNQFVYQNVVKIFQDYSLTSNIDGKKLTQKRRQPVIDTVHYYRQPRYQYETIPKQNIIIDQESLRKMCIDCLRNLYGFLQSQQEFKEENAQYSYQPMLLDLKDFLVEIGMKK